MKTSSLLLICGLILAVRAEGSAEEESKPSGGILSEIERAYESTKESLLGSLESAFNQTRAAGEGIGDRIEGVYNRTKNAIDEAIEQAYNKAKERVEKSGFNIEDFYNEIRDKIAQSREYILNATSPVTEESATVDPSMGEEAELRSIIVAPLRCESDQVMVNGNCRDIVR